MRRFGIVLVTLLALAAGALALPMSSLAVDTDVCVYATDHAEYRGWGTIAHPGCQPVRWTGGYDSFTAWRWTSTGWAAAQASEGVRYYVWPFGGGWSWVWSAETGWLAIRSEHVVLRRTYNSCPAACTEWWL